MTHKPYNNLAYNPTCTQCITNINNNLCTIKIFAHSVPNSIILKVLNKEKELSTNQSTYICTIIDCEIKSFLLYTTKTQIPLQLHITNNSPMPPKFTFIQFVKAHYHDTPKLLPNSTFETSTRSSKPHKKSPSISPKTKLVPSPLHPNEKKKQEPMIHQSNMISSPYTKKCISQWIPP